MRHFASKYLFEIFKRSSQKRNHLIRCLGFCNWPIRPLTHLSFYERGKICFLFQSTWCQQENLCPPFLYIQLIYIPIKVLKLFIIFQLMKTLLLVGVAKITGDTRENNELISWWNWNTIFRRKWNRKCRP